MMRLLSRAKIFLIALLAVPTLAHAFASPGVPKGFINDFAGVLAKQDVVALNEKARGIQEATGAEIAVALIPSLGGEDGKTYATELFAEWGIGQKGKDNGLLLLVAIEERELHIEVGYGLEGSVTDLQAKQIIDGVIAPAFRGGDYARGINEALSAIATLVTTGDVPEMASSPARPTTKSANALFLLLLFVGQILIAVMAKSKSWWLGGVFGAIAGTVVGSVLSSFLVGVIAVIVLVGFGLLVDYVVSRRSGRGGPPFMFFGGGGSGGGFGGGFGGFGGGSSGGGGASGRW